VRKSSLYHGLGLTQRIERVRSTQRAFNDL
jgi:hypothetical protein